MEKPGEHHLEGRAQLPELDEPSPEHHEQSDAEKKVQQDGPDVCGGVVNPGGQACEKRIHENLLLLYKET